MSAKQWWFTVQFGKHFLTNPVPMLLTGPEFIEKYYTKNPVNYDWKIIKNTSELIVLQEGKKRSHLVTVWLE